jgi:GNAT superfamily N-acetyltransferase
MTIREANAPDLMFIVQAQLSMAMETESLALDKSVVTQGVRRVLQSSDLGFYWLAEDAGQPVASVLVLKEWSDWRNGWVLWIHSLYVLPDYRRKGIFSMIYDALQQKVQQEENLRGLRLYVEKTNLVAQQAYRAVGMTDNHYTLFEWLKEY